jgi:hypothetical protein
MGHNCSQFCPKAFALVLSIKLGQFIEFFGPSSVKLRQLANDTVNSALLIEQHGSRRIAHERLSLDH